LFSAPEIFHLVHNLGHQFFDTPKLCLDRLQLFRCLDSRPILGICANIDVEFNMTVGIGDSFPYNFNLAKVKTAEREILTMFNQILEANIKC
jgi:hypothetical protein